MSRSGIVTVAGRPNAGKSTLLNRLVGEKLAITSAKPQSTRHRVTGILTRGDTQIVLADTPGLLEPRYALQRAMRGTAIKAINDADIIIYLIDASTGKHDALESAAGLDRAPAAPILTVFNKSDLVQDDVRRRLENEAPESMFISATTGAGVDDLLARVETLLPEGPFLYDVEDISAQNLRHFAAEFVREAALEQLHDEVPYAIACIIEEYREDRSPVYIRAILYAERESQKRILIGQSGSRIREIGTAARLKIEGLAGAPVYLDLWVKVLANWRRDVNALRRLGYEIAEDAKR